MMIYDIFFNVCLGLFIGGLLLSIISIILAELSTDISTEPGIDSALDSDLDLDTELDSFSIEIENDYETNIDNEFEGNFESASSEFDLDDELDIPSTPAPLILLISTGLVSFGISGILLYYILPKVTSFLMFILAPFIAYSMTKMVNQAWKSIAKSRYYSISPTSNLIGKKGEVILKVDERGGLIKIVSKTPMKFEKVHVKPLDPEISYERGEEVYILDVKDGYLLVYHNKINIWKNKYD